MRKVLAIILSILCFTMLPACSAAPVQPADIVFAFSCSAQVQIENETISCTITRAAPQSANITVLSPKELKGLSYTWGEGFTINYAGLTATNTDCILPQSSFASLIIGVLDSAFKRDVLTRVSDSALTGSFNDCVFTLTVDNKSGYIQQIEIPRYGVRATLNNYKNIA